MKSIRYILLVLFLLPLVITFFNIFARRTGIGSVGSILVLLIFATIPLFGLFSGKSWFFYYVYIAAPLQFLILGAFEWFISLFGDQAQTLSTQVQTLLPLALYFGVIVGLTIVLHKKYSQKS